MDIKKLAAAAVCAVTAANSVILPACAETAETEADPLNIVINGGNANTLENMLYRGVGMVSGNNSPRLLLDYKAENPEARTFTARHPSMTFRSKARNTPGAPEAAMAKAVRRLSGPSLSMSVSGSWEPVNTTGMSMLGSMKVTAEAV